MLNSGISSTISLRTRGSLSFSTNNYSHCSNGARPFACPSSMPCCCSCCNSMYNTVPFSASYGCSLYGLRQSSLIQWSPCRRLISGGFDCYSRLLDYDVDRIFYCDRVWNSRVCRRKGGLRKCLVYEERSFDEAEALLSLLTEDVGEEGFVVRKEIRRSVRKPAVEKREKDEVCSKCGSEKKNGLVVRSRKNDNRRRKEIIRREDEEETLLRDENQKVRLREEHKKGGLLKNLAEREKEEREGLLRKARQNTEEKQEREQKNQKVRLRTEEENFLRREEQRQKVRKDGSSCSSYYSLSSNGDYDSENETELTEGRFQDSLIDHKRNSNNNEIVYQDTREENQRHEDYREDHGFSLTKKSSSKEFHTGSGILESDFRKKSEKRLTDISVEEMESRKEMSLEESTTSMAHESNYEKTSDYRSMKIDEERKQQHRQTGDEVSKQSETMKKYKQSTDRQDFLSGDVRKFSGSQKLYGQKDGMSAKVASSNQRDSRKIAEVSEIQEVDIRKTSISPQRFESNVRAEEYSNNTRSSISHAKKQYDQESGLVELRGKSRQLTRRDGKSILIRETGELSKQEENMNLVSSSSLESKEHSRNESDELNKVLITHTGNNGAFISETLVTPPPNLPETSALSQGSNFGTATEEGTIGSAARLEKSSAHYVGEFAEQVRNELLSSEIQREKETYESKVSHKESSGGSENQQSGTKGPSDEMWKVDESSVQEASKAEVQDNASKAGSAMVKRTGKSLWNIIADIVLLRWAPHSESHSSGRKTGGRSSPNQSVSSETWFSRHEVEATEEKEGRIVIQGLSSTHQEAKTHSRFEESASSSSLGGHLKDGGTSAPSSSVIQESGSPQTSPSFPSGGEISEEHTSSGAAVDSSVPLPALRLRRSPAVHGDLEGEARESDSGMSEKLSTGSMEQTALIINEGEMKQKKLQRRDQFARDRFDEWAEAYRLEAEQLKIDEMFMREALVEAQKAADNWEVPVGAVLVHEGKIIARGCNLVEELRDSTAHAEILCIREASSMLRTWRLSETTLYVTLEPCAMCAGAILQARIDTVVWGAPNKLLGADGSWIRLFPGDGGNGTEQTDKPLAPVHPFHPKMTIRRGVLASECADAMQQFFKRRRKKDKKAVDAPTPPSCLPISNRPSKFLAKLHDAFDLMLCL